MPIAALISLGLPLIVKLIDKFLPPKSGVTQKMPLAQEILAAIMKQFAAPGVGLPGPDEQKTIIQQVVDQLNKAGILKGADTVLAPDGVDAELFDIGHNLVIEALTILKRSGLKVSV